MKMRTEQRFSIRKHAIGVASVLLGTALFTTGAVSADTVGEYVTPQLERDGLIAQTPEVEKDFRVVVIVNGQTVVDQPFKLTQTAFEASLPSHTAIEDADETLERISATNEGNTYTFEYATKQAGDYTVEIFVDGKLSGEPILYPATLTAETLSEIVAGIKSGFDTDVTLNFENVATFGKTYRLNYSTKPVAPKVEETIERIEIYVDGSKTLDEVIESKEQLERRTKELLDANASRYDGGFEDKGNVRVFTYTTKKAKLEDFKVIITVDGGTPQEYNYTGVTYETFLENFVALKEAHSHLISDGKEAQHDNVYTLSYTTPEEPKSTHSFEIYVDGKLAGEISATEYTVEAFAVTVENIFNDYATFDYLDSKAAVDAEGVQVNKYYFATKPVVEETPEETTKHAFEIYVDGKLAGEISATEYTTEAYAVTLENLKADYATFDYSDWTVDVDADGVHVNKFYFITKVEAKGESTTEEPKPEFVSEKTEDPTVDALSALRNELLAAIDASKLSDAQKSDLAVKVAAAETEKELQAVKAEFDKLVAGLKADSTVDALSALRNELLAAIDASKLSDAQKSDLAVKVAFAETEKELQAIKAEFDKLVAGLKAETKKEAPKADAKADAKKLPETGAKETVALVGMGMVLVLASIGLASVKRRF